MKLILTFLLFISFPVIALSDYKYIINNTSTVDSSGELVTAGDKTVIGKMFAADRNTGTMTGLIKNNYLSQPVVLDYGSNENSL